MQTTTTQSLNIAFQSLPDKIKDWLASVDIVLRIEQILIRFNIGNLEQETIIPDLILRLCVQNLDPRDFIGTLSTQLKIDFETAKKITQDIERDILQVIEIELRRDVGVDIKSLYFGNAGAQTPRPINTSTPPRVQESQPLPIKPTEPPSGPNVSSWLKPKGQPFVSTPLPTTKPSTPQITPTQQKPPMPSAGQKIDLEHFEIKGEPFILHQEPGINSSPEPQRASPGLSFKIQTSSPDAEKPISQKPVSVKLETPRTVNYSDFRTPLPPTPTQPRSEEPRKNIVDLRNNK